MRTYHPPEECRRQLQIILGIFIIWISLRAQRLKKFKILKFSSEIEHFKRAAHQTPFFCGEFRRSGLEISSEIEIFKRD